MPWTNELFKRIFRKNRIKVIGNDDFLANSEEFVSEQTGTIFLPTPGAGKRHIVKYVSVRSDGDAGEIYLEGTLNGSPLIIGKNYVSKFRAFTANEIAIALDENTPITLTSTTGTSKIFIALQYVIEDV